MNSYIKTPIPAATVCNAIAAVALVLCSPAGWANYAGVNFAGEATVAGHQLASTDAAGLISGKFWANATGTSGQVAVEIDGGTSMPVFYSGFTAQWQGADVGASESSSLLPNSRLMRGSLVSEPGESVLVQFSGIPLIYTSGNYALLVYCDVPENTADVVIKADLQAGATVRTAYLRDSAEIDFSGSFSRTPVTGSPDAGSDTLPANVFIFTGLNASDLAVSIEPAGSNPEAVVAVNAMQIVPASALASLVPRITSSLKISTTVNQPFTYTIQTDLAATTFGATGLPAGLAIDPSTGVISGSPTVTGTFQVTITATSNAGTATETLDLTVTGGASAELDIYMVPAVVVRGQIGERHLVEYVDLLGAPHDWKPAGTVTLTNAAQFYVDLSATNHNQRYYRATLQQ